MRSAHRIQVARAEHKFSCAHMTVFPDGRKERLHGHNYTVAVALDLASVSFDQLIDFASIKREVAALCAEWRERTLVAERNPATAILRRSDGELELTVCGRRYVLPEEDALLLPIDNTTVEALSAHWAELLATRLAAVLDRSAAIGLEVRVEESPGQGASTYRELSRVPLTSVSARE
ncbi:MAG TPA: 6-carboxytetrahydropterin synthase [Kofleriaceae bacterium]|nr:6-carboxytetrahydropterin synthase [Kofleriaceae bacterium]